MSSNGVMLQDYVPEAINNLTEEIWCAGAVIPRGKRVVIGHNRDGWQEITFTMGPMQDFIGMAMVPPEVIGIEEPQRIPGVGSAMRTGLMPQGVAAMAVRSGRSQQGPSSVYVNALFTSVGGGVFSGEVGGRSVQATFAGTYYNEVQGAQSGKPIGVRGWVQYDAANRQYYGNVTVTIGQHTNVSLYMRAVLESSGSFQSAVNPVARPAAFARRGLYGSPESEAPADLPEGWPNIPGTGLMPQGVAAMSVRQGRSQQVGPVSQQQGLIKCVTGEPWIAVYGKPNTSTPLTDGQTGYFSLGTQVRVLSKSGSWSFVQGSGYLGGAGQGPLTPLSGWVQTWALGDCGAIDQNAPLPPSYSPQNAHQALVDSGRPSDRLVDDFRDSIGGKCPTGQAVFGKYANGNIVQFDADWFTALKNNPDMRTGLVSLFCGWPHGQTEAPITPRGGFQHQPPLSPRTPSQGSSRMGPVWPVGMPAAVARTRLRGVYGLNTGVGAAGASAFTMAAAQALNDHLVTNNCAGCNDMTSQLRQLTFAFKAAVMTDTGISPQMNLNMSNALAMTAYGSGTDQALKNILGAAGVYANGPCTDDNGNCLGNLSTPVVPPATAALEQQVVKAIQAAIQQAPYIPQPELVKSLVQGFAALVNQIGFELAKLKPVIFVDNQPPAKPPPAPPPAAPPEKKIPWGTVLLGGLIGTAVLGTGVLLYTHARHS